MTAGGAGAPYRAPTRGAARDPDRQASRASRRVDNDIATIGSGRLGPGRGPGQPRRSRAGGRPAAVLERRPGQAGDPRSRPRHHRRGQPRLRGARGTARHLRPGRHAVGRAPDLQPGGVRARPGGRSWRPSIPSGRRRSRSRPCSRATARPWQALLARPRGDRVRDPCRDDGRGVQHDRGRLGGQGHGPPLAQALHRAGLPADAGGAGAAARPWLPHLHRHRRRPGLRARPTPSASTGSPRPR